MLQVLSNLFISTHSNVDADVREFYAESGYVRDADKSGMIMSKMKKVTLEDRRTLIANVSWNYYVVDNLCKHFGGDLSEGMFKGDILSESSG